ncbi:hypothetical protein C1645_772149 [Glomus cerebriforme]|uniref:Hydrophobin n=1 Tax=Glomus cerebriforme TaxID=658196 RepID=A0A397SWW9_9GLOM|nr:hypothetical protein C1645_772149 [Glomus cerebriforme]
MKVFLSTFFLIFYFALVSARFGQEEKNPAIKQLENFMTGDIGGFLADVSGVCIDSLLVAAPPCSVQDQCDTIIDVAYFLGGVRKAQLIKLAQRIAVSEKNTPNAGQRSVVCNKTPRHSELNGLKAKQDPTKGPGSKLPPFVPRKFAKIRVFKFDPKKFNRNDS